MLRGMDEGRLIAERMYGAFNGRDAAATGEIFADDFHSHPLRATGPECVRDAWQRMWAHHPRIEVRLVDLVTDGQRVATRTEVVGFADGSAATMLEMFTVAGGRIRELWGLSSQPQAPARG